MVHREKTINSFGGLLHGNKRFLSPVHLGTMDNMAPFVVIKKKKKCIFYNLMSPKFHLLEQLTIYLGLCLLSFL